MRFPLTSLSVEPIMQRNNIVLFEMATYVDLKLLARLSQDLWATIYHPNQISTRCVYDFLHSDLTIKYSRPSLTSLICSLGAILVNLCPFSDTSGKKIQHTKQ